MNPYVASTLISTGGSLLGGLMSGGSEKPDPRLRQDQLNFFQADQALNRYFHESAKVYGTQERQAAERYQSEEYTRRAALDAQIQSTQLQRMAKDAAAAGIHPLAALGGASYAPIGSSPVSQGSQAPQSGSSGVPNSVGTRGGGNAAGSAILNAARELSRLPQAKADADFRRSQTRLNDAEASVIEAQLKTFENDVRHSNQSGRPRLSNAGNPEAVREVRPSATPPGNRAKRDIDPRLADASAYEDRYGEYAGGVLGATNFLIDKRFEAFSFNTARKFPKSKREAVRKRIYELAKANRKKSLRWVRDRVFREFGVSNTPKGIPEFGGP